MVPGPKAENRVKADTKSAARGITGYSAKRFHNYHISLSIYDNNKESFNCQPVNSGA